MGKSRGAEAAFRPGLAWPIFWALLCAAFFLVPDQLILRWKLLAVEAAAALTLAAAVSQAARAGAWAACPLDLPVALYGLGALAFYGLSPERAVSATELCRELFACACYFAATQVFARSARPRLTLLALPLAAAASAAYALSQAGPERAAGNFGNPVLLGAAMAGAAALTAGLALDSEQKFVRQTCWGCLLLELAGLWASGTRAAWLGLFAAACVWLAFRAQGRRRLLAGAGMLAAGAGLAFAFRARAWTHGLIWDGAIRLWQAHPWLGCGLGRFYAEFPSYASPRLRALWPQGRVIVNYAHNEYLQTLDETGLAGLALLLYIPASLASQLSRRRGPAAALAPALCAVALFAGALFSPDLRFGPSVFLAFGGLGAASALLEARALKLPKGSAPTFAVCGLAAVAAWSCLAAQPYLAQKRLAAEPAFELQATPEVRERARRLEDELAKDPNNAALAEQLGYLYAQVRAWQPALSRFELAERLAPSPAVENDLGNVCYVLNRPSEAERHWKRSLQMSPGQADARVNLAKLYFEQGRIHEASAQAQAALRADPSNGKARILLKKMVE